MISHTNIFYHIRKSLSSGISRKCVFSLKIRENTKTTDAWKKRRTTQKNIGKCEKKVDSEENL